MARKPMRRVMVNLAIEEGEALELAAHNDRRTLGAQIRMYVRRALEAAGLLESRAA